LHNLLLTTIAACTANGSLGILIWFLIACRETFIFPMTPSPTSLFLQYHIWFHLVFFSIQSPQKSVHGCPVYCAISHSRRSGARTNEKQALAWHHYKLYLLSIGIRDDWFLVSFDRGQRHKILGAFAAALREGRFSSTKSASLRSGSIRTTLDCVSQTFRLANKPDPRLDVNGNIAFVLQRQLRCYSTSDPGKGQQVAVTGSILHHFHKSSISPMDVAFCELFIGAFFFAMRSCEYLRTSGQRKTKLLTLHNIRFFIGNCLIPHDSIHLHAADTVTITFEHQKRDVKNNIITHHKTKDKLLCPVKIWSNIIRRLRSYPSSTDKTPVNTFFHSDGSKTLFTGTVLLKRLRMAATAIGKDKLGFTANQIGLHSARGRAAMAMYLAGVPVFTIMLLGCWSSDAFLRYIRKQVKEFSSGISQKMITHEQFFTVPMASSEDPRVRNHPLNLALRQISGNSFRDAILPLASVFH
jgi:hypothetical protein